MSEEQVRQQLEMQERMYEVLLAQLETKLEVVQPSSTVGALPRIPSDKSASNLLVRLQPLTLELASLWLLETKSTCPGRPESG